VRQGVIATYHNHSRWSDGKCTLQELRSGAVRLGVEELGVSDHLALTPWGEHVAWSMPVEAVSAYAVDVLGLHQLDGPRIRLGLEVDWFPGHEVAIGRVLRRFPLDYVIGSVHYVDRFCIDSHAEKWERLTEPERNEIHRGYWERIRSMAESGLFDIAAHLDLTKKFGFHPRCDLRALIASALDAIAESKMVVELNTAGWHKPCRDAYPSLDILHECRRRLIPVTISADAHQAEHLLRDFDRAANRLAAAGYGEVVRFAQRRRYSEPLRTAVAAS
jgi:histidinol-phosphatase (PHP family)